MSIVSKKCSKCGVVKSVSEFHKSSKTKKDGLRTECKACVLAYQHREENRTRHTAYMKVYHADEGQKEIDRVYRESYHPAYYEKNAEKIKARTRQWTAENPEHKHAKDKAYRESNKEKIKQGYKDWLSRSRHVLKACLLKRQAREKNAEGYFSGTQWKALIEYYSPNGECLACGVISKMTVDHVVPLAKGGTNYIYNIQPLCGKCNRSKWVNTTDYRPDGGAYARSLHYG